MELNTIIDNYIINILRKRSIIIISLFLAFILNIDKIILGSFSVIRIHDTFDGGFLFAPTIARYIWKYGFIAQLPQIICGISNFTFSVPLSSELAQLILPVYINYLIHSILITFVAFLGMFLLLRDEFALSKEASFLGAVFFSSYANFTPYSITVVGIPLLIWALERIFDENYAFKQKLILYSYILFYFVSNVMFLIAFSLMPFYFTYFLFLSKIKKNAKNIIILCLIWSLYIFINLPILVQLFFQAQNSHRQFWCQGLSWIDSLKYLISKIFFIGQDDEWTITMPSLLGLLVIIYYFISLRKSTRNKKINFVMIWIVCLYLFSFFIFNSPLGLTLRHQMGILRSLQFYRAYFLLTILFSILIGIVCNSCITENKFLNKRNWIISISVIILYMLIALSLLNFNRTSKIEFALQFVSLLIFIFLLVLKTNKKQNISIFSLLSIPFLFFMLTNTLSLRFHWSGINNYFHFFNSEQIEKVKEIEKDNLDNFRVVGGQHPAQLLQNGFQCADGYIMLYPQSYKEFWIKTIEPEITKSKTFRDFFLYWGSKIYLFDSLNQGKTIGELSFNLDLLKLINVKYLFVGKEILNYKKYGLIEVARIDPDYPKLPKWKKYFRKSEFYVYQIENFAEQAFLTDLIKTFDAKKDLLHELGKDFNYLKTHTLALKEDAENLNLNNLETSFAAIINYKLTPDYILVNLHNRYPLILNWTRNFDNFWVCKIDGIETPIFKIYNTFMGVIVPSNSHKIEFRYQNHYLNTSYFISTSAVVLITIFVVTFFRSLNCQDSKKR